MSDEPRPAAVESDPNVSPAAAETYNPFAAYSPVETPPMPVAPAGLTQTVIGPESSSNILDQTSVGGKAAPMEPALSGLLSAPHAPGELGRLGGYKVTKILGRGGMGMVLAAEDPHLGRSVAIKVMLPTIAAQQEARQRFLLEAKSAAAVEHENIIPIWQVAEDRGVPFLAMPLLNGVSLDEALKMGVPLPLPMVFGIATQVADGLAAAHAAGLIHRDIKPSNIWLEMNADGSFRRARILDFGLARLESGDGGLTKSGMILGTPAYMAPEQARGQKVDGRADLFSYGATLYQMTTGRRPFTGTDELSLLTSLAIDIPTPVRQVNPSVPGPLSDLIDR
jgi:serine/threonine protein kinase